MQEDLEFPEGTDFSSMLSDANSAEGGNGGMESFARYFPVGNNLWFTVYPNCLSLWRKIHVTMEEKRQVDFL